jgi:hypothetical protein
LTQGKKLQRQFGSAHSQTTNENEDHLAERYFPSAHEVFSAGGVWREIKPAARLKGPDEIFSPLSDDTHFYNTFACREYSGTPE